MSGMEAKPQRHNLKPGGERAQVNDPTGRKLREGETQHVAFSAWLHFEEA